MSGSCHVRGSPRPAWGTLYAIAGIALGAVAASDLLLPEGLGRTLGEGAGALAAFAALKLWVRGNRAALAAEARCCSAPLTIRVAHLGDLTAVPAADPAPALLEARTDVEHEELV
jgi:hypothetical protein